jgi:hypothetical protein
VTAVGDVELEIVLHIAVRGRTRDLARLLKAIDEAEAVVIWLIKKRAASGEQGQKHVTTTAGGFSG